MMMYPDTRTDESIESIAGISFPDPYRWLEESTEEVRLWQQAQSNLASAYVREWPHFDRLRKLVAAMPAERVVTLPRYAAGLWFRTQMAAGVSHAQVIVSEAPTGGGRVIFDPCKETPEHPGFVSWIAPSPDGRSLALGLCVDGSEANSIHLVDIQSGQALKDPPPQQLMDNWTGGVSWLPDSSGFFFSALCCRGVGIAQQVFLHHRRPAPTTHTVHINWTTGSPERQDYRMVIVSGDGRYAMAVERRRNPVPIAIAALGAAVLLWRPFITEFPDNTVAGHIVGDRYIAVTDVGAARGRLVAIPLEASDPNDSRNWVELAGESDAVMRAVTVIGKFLYLHEYVDTYARVRILDLSGRHLSEVPLPGRGAISEHPFPMVNLIPRGHPDHFLFGFSSFDASWGIYSHTPGEEDVETLQSPHVKLAGAVVEDHWVASSDGTRIPYHLIHRGDVKQGSPQPTLIYAYGGLNVACSPQFPGPMAAFVAAGGVFVLAHLRGGGELGREWWHGGRLRAKQNCYDDLFAVAEDLIRARRTTEQLLAVVGGSNGGLMAAVAATQRPDLWKAVVPRVPILDLIGACRESYGRQIVLSEFCASLDDQEEVRRLASFSPYQLVKQGVRYPAVFLEAGASDPRCPPWHARKFAARLQREAVSAPTLLHVWENAGHGWATNKEISSMQHAEWLAFVMRHLGFEEWCYAGE